METKRTSQRIKVLSMGEGGVGKSCLIKRYCEQKFISRYISTIGVDFGVRTVTVPVDGRECEAKVNFWDLSGHPEFFDVRTEFYKDTHAALLVFDVTSKKTFSALDQWLQEQAKFAENQKPTITVVCANKTDMPKRAVSEAEAAKWASDRGFMYFETSAKSGSAVNEMFVAMFKAVIQGLPAS